MLSSPCCGWLGWPLEQHPQIIIAVPPLAQQLGPLPVTVFDLVGVLATRVAPIGARMRGLHPPLAPAYVVEFEQYGSASELLLDTRQLRRDGPFCVCGGVAVLLLLCGQPLRCAFSIAI